MKITTIDGNSMTPQRVKPDEVHLIDEVGCLFVNAMLLVVEDFLKAELVNLEEEDEC
jgi:hypothetical protein